MYSVYGTPISSPLAVVVVIVPPNVWLHGPCHAKEFVFKNSLLVRQSFRFIQSWCIFSSSLVASRVCNVRRALSGCNVNSVHNNRWIDSMPTNITCIVHCMWHMWWWWWWYTHKHITQYKTVHFRVCSRVCAVCWCAFGTVHSVHAAGAALCVRKAIRAHFLSASESYETPFCVVVVVVVAATVCENHSRFLSTSALLSHNPNGTVVCCGDFQPLSASRLRGRPFWRCWHWQNSYHYFIIIIIITCVGGLYTVCTELALC